MSSSIELLIHTDGGARGNPGPAATGVVIQIQNQTHTVSRYLGITSNNVAEYSAVIDALSWVTTTYPQGVSRIKVYADSLLMVNQLSGVYKIKDSKLKSLAVTIGGLIGKTGAQVSFTYIPRNQNKAADALVNQTLDQQSQL